MLYVNIYKYVIATEDGDFPIVFQCTIVQMPSLIERSLFSNLKAISFFSKTAKETRIAHL